MKRRDFVKAITSNRSSSAKANSRPRRSSCIRSAKTGSCTWASRGNWASLTTKPLALFSPELRLNALAPYGELAFQVTDLLSKPIAGYTFDDCVPLKEVDALDAPLRFRGKADLSELMNRPIRLQMKFRGARIHAMRGQFHWLDALDVALLKDGKPIDREFFDFMLTEDFDLR